MTEAIHYNNAVGVSATRSDEITLGDFAAAIRQRWRLAAGAPVLASVLTLGGSYLISPTFTARTSFLPPQQQQGAAAGALASLGALAGIAGGGVKSSGDQYLAFLQSRTVADRMVDRFDLKQIYDTKLRHDALLELAQNTRTSLGKKDGLITLEVDDHDPKRAAEMAAAYVEELRRLTAGLALTEAQQRRAFFEGQLNTAREKLEAAQTALQGSGISAGAIRAEPKATAESFAKLKAEATTADIRLQALRRSLSDQTAEVQQQLAIVSGLRTEMERQGRAESSNAQSGYLGAYRDFKYHEALFDLLARQYELAKVDESRDGGQLQLIDAAQVPERKSKPKRSMLMLAAAGLTFLGICIHTGVLLARRRRLGTRVD
ncbi:GNVR domain-containing protein [Paucibacter soli]|uniref:GNVR domain-containing protein n=1 Tax=Paucibacter soli TaxID=3133433 RepID=UPI00309FFAAD